VQNGIFPTFMTQETQNIIIFAKGLIIICLRFIMAKRV